MVDGARSFLATGRAYDGFIGRYSQPLAVAFADAAGVGSDGTAVDIGCGPGALTGVLAARLGPGSVTAVDPSPPFLAECAARHPGIAVASGQAEALPLADASVDFALAQLVLHFVSDPSRAGAEFRRVLRPGGVAAACVWDFAGQMEMLRLFWDAALALDPEAPDEARTLRFGREGEIADLLTASGLAEITETTLVVRSRYAGFDELWSGFLAGVGPAGSYCVALPEDHRQALREALFRRMDCPTGEFMLSATARCASGRSPG
jgi:SAM-dependent methyltransferase